MTLLLLAQLAAFALPVTMPPLPPPPPIFQQAQEPRVLPSHRVGPHEGEPGATCYRGETQASATGTMYHCACKLLCLPEDCGLRREDDNCETSCGHDQCVCHADESCDMTNMPDVPK